MEFRLRQVSNSDTTLSYNGQNHNLGPHHMLENVALFWLANLQRGKGNTFTDFELPIIEIDWRTHELEEVLEESISVAQSLPLSVSDFNGEILLRGLSHFNNGLNSIYYKFILGEDGRLHLKRSFRDYPERVQEEILSLDPNNTANLARQYARFIAEGDYGRFRAEMRFLVKKLEEYGGEIKPSD